jgi:hypothetical protein
VDADAVSAIGTAASFGVSLAALGVSVAAWRAAHKSANADERVSQVETIRGHGELEPEWRVDAISTGNDTSPYEMRVQLIGPKALTLPCSVTITIGLFRGGKYYHLAETGKKYPIPGTEFRWEGASTVNPLQRATSIWRMTKGTMQRLTIPPLPRTRSRDIMLGGEAGSFSVELKTLLPPYQPWLHEKQFPIPMPPAGVPSWTVDPSQET